ncbi:MAG: hypothetical protein KDC98_00385 [Planctomycetes bacterium]|nr:hypothetical protein [Planctomycetota bacterium]
MTGRLAWWTIPGAIVVLARVITLSPGSIGSPRPSMAANAPGSSGAVAAIATERSAAAQPAALSELSGPVIVQDVSGRRRGPLWLSFDNALILQLPAATAGTTVELSLERYAGDDGQRSEWLAASLPVRADATLPFANLPAGRYALEISWNVAGAAQRIVRDLESPGTIDLR